MRNLASHEFNSEYNRAVYDELTEAGIPIVNVGRLDNEVKTNYIGMLNGFVFIRAWYYWVVKGWMPLEHAKYLYENYKDLQIRASGDAGNPDPESCSECKDSKTLAKNALDRVRAKEMTMEEANAEYMLRIKEGEQFIDMYHIDTQAGLNRFVEVIKNNSIHTEIIE